MIKFPRLIVHTKLLLLTLLVSVSLTAQNISGKYILVKDSDGKTPRGGAEISITFSPGKFSLKAAMPGQTVTDIGTWKITGSTMTISFKEMEQGTKTGPYSLNNGTLTLPFMMLSNGKGSSTWQDAAGYTPPPAVTTTTGAIFEKAITATKKTGQYCSMLDERAAAMAKKMNNNLSAAYYTNALTFYFKNYPVEALYGFAKAAQLQPTNGLYLNNVAKLLMNIRKYDDAIVLLRDASRRFPNTPSPWGNLAAAYYENNNIPKADSMIRIARRLAPDNGLFCYVEGLIEKKKGDPVKSKKSFAEAASLGYTGEETEGNPAKNATPRKSSKKPKNGKGKNNQSQPKTKDEKIAQYEGHYEAEVVSARSGENAKDANTKFGDGMASTTINLQTLACTKNFSMDISRSGFISGGGQVMYVYQGGASAPITGMAPPPLAAANGNFTTNLKDGFQIREWSFTGTIDEEGNIEIRGLPSGDLDLLNVGKWQKIKTWSPLMPDAAGAAMKGPFHMKMEIDEEGEPYISIDDYLELGDKLIRKVHYQTFIYRSDENITPDCDYEEPEEAPKCGAREFIKTKVAYSPAEGISIEGSKTFSKGPDGTVQAQQEMAVNVGSEFPLKLPMRKAPLGGLLVGSAEFHQDGSAEFTAGIGVDTEKYFKESPFALSEKLELVWDTKCGLGVKASAGIKNELTKTGYSVEGVIFLNVGMK